MEEVCRKEKGFVAIDYELAEWLFDDHDFFPYLAKKAKIDMGEKVAVVCNGSTIYRADIATRKPCLFFSPGKNEPDVLPIGKLYVGKMPKIYQLVYRLPNMPYSFPKLLD